MNFDENEPMPPRPVELQALPPVRMGAGQKAMLWSRVEASAAVAAAATEAVAQSGGAEHQMSAERLATSAGAAPSLVAKAGLNSAVVKWGLAALVTGVAAGAAVDRYGFPPEPTVVERVVVRTQEVRVEVPLPAPPTAPPTPAARTALQKSEPKEQRPVQKEPAVEAAGTNLERQLLEGARTALVRRDANFALETLDKLRREFPRGQLAEERDSLQVQALQQAKREADAKAAARTFLERYPHSVFGPAVEAVLQGEK
ncbi:MAG: hypothetical protein K1X64_03920 [Myxococcaceae bacterium]|nr:hypothetical protein [Myxococcaceae bacterium]